MVDRYKDIVKSGGENVSTIRVEAVLQQHAKVARAAVVGIPDDRWGEMVTACIILDRRRDDRRCGTDCVCARTPGRV